jgi:hypothetical protein
MFFSSSLPPTSKGKFRDRYERLEMSLVSFDCESYPCYYREYSTILELLVQTRVSP